MNGKNTTLETAKLADVLPAYQKDIPHSVIQIEYNKLCDMLKIPR